MGLEFCRVGWKSRGFAAEIPTGRPDQCARGRRNLKWRPQDEKKKRTGRANPRTAAARSLPEPGEPIAQEKWPVKIFYFFYMPGTAGRREMLKDVRDEAA